MCAMGEECCHSSLNEWFFFLLHSFSPFQYRIFTTFTKGKFILLIRNFSKWILSWLFSAFGSSHCSTCDLLTLVTFAESSQKAHLKFHFGLPLFTGSQSQHKKGKMDSFGTYLIFTNCLSRSSFTKLSNSFYKLCFFESIRVSFAWK